MREVFIFHVDRFGDVGYYKWLLAKSCLDAANKIPEGSWVVSVGGAVFVVVQLVGGAVC